jgi:hypothetical protein
LSDRHGYGRQTLMVIGIAIDRAIDEIDHVSS